jgi:hypothetical protein
MRLVRVIFMALFGAMAVVAGLFIAAALAVIGALATVMARLLRGSGSNRRAEMRGTAPRGASSDVIEVTATEVRDGREQQLPR